MTNIINYNSVSIQELMDNLQRYKYNPSGIQQTILEHLDEITDGKVDIVDPTNPFVFLLESSSVNTALAIQENIVNLRKQYPSLSQTEEELYLHMSDKDFVNRFAVPSETDFTVVVQVNDLLTKMVYDPGEDCFKVTIPRNTVFIVDDLTFSIQYPINIRRYLSGVMQVSYDGREVSPLQTLTTNIIDYSVRRDTSQVDWLFFNVPAKQFFIESQYFSIQRSSIFSQNIPYEDKFYHCRVWYRNTSTSNAWKEMIVTHTDQVYDIYKPTAVLKVFENEINVYIPPVYITTELVVGDIRVDIYSTKGNLTINLSNYKVTSFSMDLKAIDEVKDLNDYTNAMSDISYYAFSDKTIGGGYDGVDFHTLRERVIFNSAGDRQLPITNIQLEAQVNNLGFDLVKNVDVVTNRIFLATRHLPSPTNERLITPANIGIGTYTFNIDELKLLDNKSIDNGDRVTLLSNNIFIFDNGLIRLVSDSELAAIKLMSKHNLVSEINSKQYLYNPFHYVLDSSGNEFEVRAYYLDNPIARHLNFILQNHTLQLPVNTFTYELSKVKYGYKLIVETKSGNFYKQIEDDLVHMQLGFKPVGENNLAYINGELIGKTAENERIYEFFIETNHDINNDNFINITNSRMYSNDLVSAWCSLTLEVNLFYATNSLTDIYVPSVSDNLLGIFLLPNNAAVVTHEKLTLTLGDALKNMWSRTRSFPTGLEYERYPGDVPMLYETTIYETDPQTGSIFDIIDGEIVYNILHEINDPVLDEFDEPVYKHRKGDAILDIDGNPIINTTLQAHKELDILFVDAKYLFADDLVYLDYKQEISDILSTWVVRDLITIQNVLLEQTKIYFYPKTTIGDVKIHVDKNNDDFISSEQSLIVDLYVKSYVFNNPDIRNNLVDNTVRLLNQSIDNNIVNITDITIALNKMYGETVDSLRLSNLGGSKNYNIIELAAEHNRLSLKKKLVLQNDNIIIVKEDVEVNFHNIEKPIQLN